jgi:hypothetical protein
MMPPPASQSSTSTQEEGGSVSSQRTLGFMVQIYRKRRNGFNSAELLQVSGSVHEPDYCYEPENYKVSYIAFYVLSSIISSIVPNINRIARKHPKMKISCGIIISAIAAAIATASPA